MKRDKGKAKRKRVRYRARWVFLLLLVLGAGVAIEYMRMGLSENNVNVTAPFRPQYSINENPQSSIDLAADICGITAFSRQYDTSGMGQKIALIDSGIDLSHPAFGNNDDGSAKVAAFYDYTDEGVLYTEEVYQEGHYVSAGGMQYEIGAIYNNADNFYMAFLQLDTLCPQMLDRDTGTIAVLVTAVGSQYDCVYLDTNRNGSFTDERPMYCYQDGGGHVTLQYSTCQMEVVVSTIAPDGRCVHISTDTLGHGTFLSGVIAANGVDYDGLAPNAQLYIYKIFDKNGASSQQKLADAIEQAVEDGVDSINLSLSIPREESISPALSRAIQTAARAEIPIIAAAGNYGPGKDTIAYPARASGVIGVGSVSYPEQYLLDRAVMLEDCFVADYSGRGNIDAQTAPLLVAPSGLISTVPTWYKESYLYDYGTSISAAIVTAAVSHLQESVQKGQLADVTHLSVDQIRYLLATWAQDLSYDVSEQGHGALYMGQLPNQIDSVELSQLSNTLPVIYQFQQYDTFAAQASDEKSTLVKKELFWPFSVAQGQSRFWYMMVPDDAKTLEISLLLDTQQPSSPFEHLIAMGRCRMYVYDPDGKLVDATEYIGATYGRDLQTNAAVSVWRPQNGVWEVVVTSADNLSVYHHFESTGFIRAEVR